MKECLKASSFVVPFNNQNWYKFYRCVHILDIPTLGPTTSAPAPFYSNSSIPVTPSSSNFVSNKTSTPTSTSTSTPTPE
jgi:hypothetical protein